MKASLVSREVIADSVELTIRGHCYDALVGIVGCDKTQPVLMVAMLRLNAPAPSAQAGSFGPVEHPVDVAGFLVARRSPILERAATEVAQRRLPHYEAAGADEVALRLAALFDAVVEAAAGRHLEHALAHADSIASVRQQTGHDLSELQQAINSLEEQIWSAVVDDAPVNDQGYILGLTSTVLGAIKDRLACSYVSRAAAKPMHTLRIEELFLGTESGQA